ncbi:hypothetical protein TNCV_79111 [Trichonephila clavipes]|nr:hypothetical protein TNCV_79111 [Trichonephila clavipes]
MWPSLAAIQASQRAFILQIRLLVSSCGSNPHSSISADFNVWHVFGGYSRKAVALSKASQPCSIGSRSGEFTGHSIPQIPSSSRKSSTILALCGLTLSSTKIKS